MPILDDNGRLFGRLNLFDAAALLAALLVLVLALATYRVFLVPPPEIVSIEPSTLKIDDDPRLHVTGRNLRPYLHAFVTTAGQAPAFVDVPKNPNELMYLLERPTSAELRLPKLPRGAYDLYFYDGGREVMRRTPAFTVVGPEPPAPGEVETAVMDVTLRLDVDEALAPLIRAGDVDLSPRASWMLKPAVILSVRRLPDPYRAVGFAVSRDGSLLADLGPPRARIEAIVRTGVVKSPGGWLYGERPLRASEGWAFATTNWTASGTVIRVVIVPGLAAEKAVR